MPSSGMIMRFPGSKWYLAKWIISHFPPHRVFVDVFGGSGAIILRKPKSKVEVFNDIDKELVNLFKVLIYRKEEFMERARYLPYSRALFEEWVGKYYRLSEVKDPVERALIYFFIRNVSFSGVPWKGFSVSHTTNRAPTFKRRLEKLEEFVKRFREVMIECLDYREVLAKYDSHDTLFYCDPPYLAKDRYYEHEWGLEDWITFADNVRRVKGKVCVSSSWFPQLLSLFRGWYYDVKERYVSIGFRRNEPRPKMKEYLIMNYPGYGKRIG